MEWKDFERKINKKRSTTESLLVAYDKLVNDEQRNDLAKTYEYVARSASYRDNYVAVNVVSNDSGKITLVPVINELVLVNELRSFKIQQIDYADRFIVFSTVHNQLTKDDIVNQEAYRFLEKYNSMTRATEKMKYLCESAISGTISSSAMEIILGQIPDSDYIKSYYLALGPSKLKALDYRRGNIEKALGIVTFSEDLLIQKIYSNFKEGERYSMYELKIKLCDIYNEINYSKTPKASDLGEWFEVKKCKICIENSNKRADGFELIKSRRNALDEKYGK